MTHAGTDPSAEAPGVGIVVVSHSWALARAAVELAQEMVHDQPVRVAVAAGLDETTLGTDAVRIADAIQEVDGPAGVVVLMDLGSAVLSAELALDLLDDADLRDRVVLSAAPLVEGLVVAVVAAAGGADRHEVAAEASAALLAKSEHLGGPAPDAARPGPATDPAPDAEGSSDRVGTFTIANAHGLHARPAARLVGVVRSLDADVRLRNLTTGVGPIPAASLTRVATLGALAGHEVQILAAGPQAREAIERLVALAARQFDEAPVPPEPAFGGESRAPRLSPPKAGGSGPLGASPGIGIGPVRRLAVPTPAALTAADRVPTGDPAAEWQRSVEAAAAVREEVERVRAVTARDAGAEHAGIFDAHLMLLDDAEVLADVRKRIESGASAAGAWNDALADVEKQWSELSDPYLRARAEDVRAVRAQVLAALGGAPAATMTAPGILVAEELTPAQTTELDRDVVQGIVLAYGSPTSHAVILARSRGIPAVVAAGPDVLGLPEGTLIVIDGGTGELVVDPSAAVRAAFGERAAVRAEQDRRERAAAGAPAVTADDVEIEVAANVGSPADARAALAAGADSIGLVRTEFLFLDRDTAPDVDEQIAQYRAIAEAMDGRRITLRTMDVGGDKPLAYLPMPAEANPFLGHRGLRLSLDRPDLLRDQLRAVCVVARLAPVSVMFPMVSTVAELRAARRLLDEVAGPAGRPAGLRVGMMVEVPAAALKTASFLADLDFISIGTNDLTQYTLAAERGNAAVAALSDPLDPGVLRLIDHVCRSAAGRVPVAVCGEAAADPGAIPVLLGLGVDELSVSAHAVPAVKARVRELDRSRCRDLARVALDLDDATAVRARVATRLADQSAGPAGGVDSS